MGCFSKPTLQIPETPQYKQAPELYQTALDWAEANFPRAFGAREKALGEIQAGGFGVTPEYYEQWQPTSFEEALANQYFSSVWPGVEREIKHGLSLSGMAESPILAKTLGEQRGKLGVDIGTILANLGQRRAELGIQAKQQGLMAQMIDPRNVYGPYLETDILQSTLQTEADYQTALAQAIQDYEKARQPKSWEVGLSKMMSIADPGGAYMGTYENPYQETGPSAQSMQGLGKAADLYAAYKGVGGTQFGQVGQEQNYGNIPSYGGYGYGGNYNPYASQYGSAPSYGGYDSTPGYGFNWSGYRKTAQPVY